MMSKKSCGFESTFGRVSYRLFLNAHQKHFPLDSLYNDLFCLQSKHSAIRIANTQAPFFRVVGGGGRGSSPDGSLAETGSPVCFDQACSIIINERRQQVVIIDNVKSLQCAAGARHVVQRKQSRPFRRPLRDRSLFSQQPMDSRQEVQLVRRTAEKPEEDVPRSAQRKSFFKIKESAQLQNRRKGLEEFIKLIVVRKDIISSQTFRTFLQLDQHAQQVILNPPTLAGQFEIDVPAKESRGVRAFSIDRESFTFFVATGEMSILNKFNAAITNSKVFSKEQTSFKVAGSVECYIRKEESKTFQKTWSRNYPIQAICLEWSVGNQCLIVGLDDGTIQILKTTSQNNFLSYQLKVSSKVHTARVMGVQYDPFSNSVFSVSEDCQFRICQDEHLFKIWGYNHKVSLTGIQYDYVNKRAILVSAKGDFYVYDINDRKSPKQLANLSTQSKGCIRGLCVDFSSNYAFTGGFDDGEICVFFIDKPGRQKYTNLNAVYKGKDKVRTIGWSNERHQIMVGSANGTVTFWNPNKAETLYVQKCHDTQLTQLKYLQSEKMMVTSSKGKEIKFWRLPQEWRSKEVEDQEHKDADTFRKANMAKYVVDAVANKDNDSDDDDLAGWHKD